MAYLTRRKKQTGLGFKFKLGALFVAFVVLGVTYLHGCIENGTEKRNVGGRIQEYVRQIAELERSANATRSQLETVRKVENINRKMQEYGIVLVPTPSSRIIKKPKPLGDDIPWENDRRKMALAKYRRDMQKASSPSESQAKR